MSNGMNRHFFTVLSLVLAAQSVGCDTNAPTGSTQSALVGPNASVSADDGIHPGSEGNGLQSEQSLVSVRRPDGTVGLVVGYNDTTNQLDSSGGFLPGFNLMGVSVSADAGGTWEPRPQNDAFPFDRTMLDGRRSDPWLATNGTHDVLFYLFLASGAGTGPGRADAFQVFRSIDGGDSWEATSEPVQMGMFIDKGSLAVSMDGNELHVAFVLPDEGLRVVTVSSRDGGETWEGVADVPEADFACQNPIIHVAPDRDDLVLLSYQFNGTEIRFAGSWDHAASWDHWATVATLTGAHPTLQADMLRVMRNVVFQSFDIDPVTLHCVIAFEDDGRIFVTSSADGTGWSAPASVAAPEIPGAIQIQPAIAAGYEGLAVVYYEQDPSGDTNVMGIVSPTHGVTWPEPAQVLNRDALGNPDPFLPCVTSSGYFGDYLGVTAIGLGDDVELDLQYYATWADARWGCVESGPGRIATHQHTVGARFW